MFYLRYQKKVLYKDGKKVEPEVCVKGDVMRIVDSDSIILCNQGETI